MQTTFRSVYLSAFFHPRKSLELLLKSGNYFSLAFRFILVPIIAYTLMYVFLTVANGAPSVLTPWLNIPKENYYAVNRYLLAPGMLISWLVAASLAQILSRLARGTGTFEQTLSALALSISIAMWGGLIHDLPMSFLSAIGVVDARQHEIDMNSPTIFRTILWTCYSIYFIYFIILFPLSIRAVHQINIWKSIVIGIFSFAVFQVLFLLFNR